ncbi:MAG: PD-(D/E)XK nuclease family protein [Patescibacteria group bacterium]|nr:PD-(D/E)XK nuclease family protein [Patescibacteria group bacterium]
MNKYKQRQGNLYQNGLEKPFSISRSKIDLFLQCPRCFYLDRRLGLGRPSMPGWALNSAVDALLKKEFDLLRKKGEQHELMKQYKIDAVPFPHPDIEEWRNNFVGKQYLHESTNLLIFGAVDDVWVNKKDELLIVDYKATSTTKEISLEDEYKQGYKRQMEIYQWIFRKSGFKVSQVGYFVFANADKNLPKFDGKLNFEVTLILYKGDDSWVGPTIFAIKKCLDSDKIPDADPDCEFCQYRRLIKDQE